MTIEQGSADLGPMPDYTNPHDPTRLRPVHRGLPDSRWAGDDDRDSAQAARLRELFIQMDEAVSKADTALMTDIWARIRRNTIEKDR